MTIDSFVTRHIGPGKDDVQKMVETLGVSSLDELIDQTVPSSIRMREPMKLQEGLTERKYYRKILNLARKNKVFNT
ncbi:MAG: hypothetical protein J7L95_02560, partial [Prolixibacteraceae bacterium]|nr:hypothetical protein [Prolixibacteraceae bacterium]